MNITTGDSLALTPRHPAEESFEQRQGHLAGPLVIVFETVADLLVVLADDNGSGSAFVGQR